MKKTYIIFALVLCAFAGTIILGGWTHGSPTVASGATYYISTSGNDSNTGLSPTLCSLSPCNGPWATPNHTLNCSATGGDTILVQPGTYSGEQFGGAPGNQQGPFGPVGTGCTGHGVFRTVKCNGTTLGSCIITDGTGGHYYPVYITTPYWIFQGFQVTDTSGVLVDGGMIAHFDNITYFGHDVVFLNNWVHDTLRAGVAGGEYTAIIGSVNYNTAAQSADSANDFYEPHAFDNLSGTHIFGAGLFVFNSAITPSDTDSEGWIFDDWDCQQQPCTAYGHVAYTNLGVIEQSLFVGNASFAVNAFNGNNSSHYLLRSTTYDNDHNSNGQGCCFAEVIASSASLFVNYSIMISTKATNVTSTGCNPTCVPTTVNVYPLVNNNGFGWVYNSNYYNIAAPSQTFSTNNGSFIIGTGNLSVDPQFTNAGLLASEPNCSNYATTTACMQGLGIIGNFTTTNASVAGMGYQPPGACRADPYWPTWVPVALIPAGLVTTPCH